MTPVGTIPSRALEIWRRLYTRFSLEPGPASVVPDVSKTIWPVTVVDAALLRSESESKALDLSVASGTFVVARTVPDGQAWTLTSIGLKSSVAGCSAAVRIDGVVVEFSDRATAANFVTLRHRLAAGDEIGATAGASGSDNARLLMASWEAEDV